MSKFGILALGVLSTFAVAFGQCPTVGHSTFQGDNQPYLTAGGGCNVLITIAANGSVSTTTPNSNPFDGIEDTLVGVVNNSSSPISSLTVSGSGISGWDGDGICAFGAGGAAGDTFTSGSSAYCSSSALAGTDPQDYYGPNMTFSSFSSGSAVTINFSPSLAAGASSFFSLEEPPSTALTVSGVTTTTSSTPAPSSISLAIIGLVALSGFFFMSRRSAQAR